MNNDLTVPWYTFMHHLDHTIPYNNQRLQGLFNQVYYLRAKVPGGLEVTQDGKVEYVPTHHDSWRRSGSPMPLPKKRRTSLIRFLRWLSQFEPNWGDGSEFQPIQDMMVEWARTTLDGSQYSFEVVTGGDLVAAYNTGPKSCMRGRTSQQALYSSNPDKVALVKIMHQGVYKGRALLWTLDDGRKFLDRIYPGNDIMAGWMRARAQEQGWEYKKLDSIGGDVSSETPLICTLAHPRNRRIPYLDTMNKLWAVDENTVTLSNACPDGIYLETVGDYIGTSDIYMGAQYKFLDGTPVCRSYEPVHNAKNFRRCVFREPDSWVRQRRGEARHKRYLKSTDRVYCLRGTNRNMEDVVMGEDGYYYLRRNVRKQAKTGTYRPRPDAQKLVITDTHTFDNGAVVMWVGPEA